MGPYIPAILFKFGLGRRPVTALIDIASAILWVVLIFMTEKLFWLGFVVRVLQGFVLGAMAGIGPLLLLEISPIDQTGLYGTFNQIFAVIGAIFMFLIGEYQKPYVMCIFSVCVHVLQLFLIWVIPAEAFKERKVEQDDKPKESICQKKYIWPFIILFVLMLCQQFSGINAIVSDLAGIFERAGIKGIRPGVQAVIATLAQILACCVSGVLIKTLGRRAMFTISGIMCAATLITFGCNNKFNWNDVLPVILIFLYGFAYGLGLGPIPWYSSPEMFDPSIRPIAASINGMASRIFCFVIVYISPAIQKSKIGMPGLMIFYGIISFLGGIFGFFFVREPVVPTDISEDPKSDYDSI
ncbi:major facilitator superfamily protein [Trichomonas vaginalis G3]|uniref:Major facilitator superfamily protein n=1 Tax=Trichomonas vaginalis (strain ATCC PRA-98 / G3) TaxID=412133 RepID=A2EQM8_TRIV3|nr:major facilitator superfamily transporter [Trichomonas vaginalis G3]EAY05075.1 major facilitator superfamily protein [Trichomonas vaginalis G3]KAI5489007.1 transmembrane transporter protein [Trichomonas vaginalis G3]|eukprot:XP_001317298.1 major facilitator superfamily transporter [Trichomonas vaginalis G3]